MDEKRIPFWVRVLATTAGFVIGMLAVRGCAALIGYVPAASFFGG